MITATNLVDTAHTDIFVSSGENGVTTLMICNHTPSVDAVVDVIAQEHRASRHVGVYVQAELREYRAGLQVATNHLER